MGLFRHCATAGLDGTSCVYDLWGAISTGASGEFEPTQVAELQLARAPPAGGGGGEGGGADEDEEEEVAQPTVVNCTQFHPFLPLLASSTGPPPHFSPPHAVHSSTSDVHVHTQ